GWSLSFALSSLFRRRAKGAGGWPCRKNSLPILPHSASFFHCLPGRFVVWCKQREFPRKEAAAVPQPLVSIIVPIYNAQDHIARCVESIRRQTYENLEILLLNDGSQDVSLQVCQMYAGVDKRIVLID